jgi:hypothetical protein
MHLALLGDSIYANRAYTGRAPDVAGHLRTVVPASTQVTLCAVDGATTASFLSQLACIPDDATHFALSLGGNDALQSQGLLHMKVGTAAVAFDLLGKRAAQFEVSYRRVVGLLLAMGKPLLVTTIYNGDFGPEEATITKTALLPFNDVIIRVAFEYGLSLVDLRPLCTEPEDYVNRIEPSGKGGLKIATALAQCLEQMDAA